MWWIDHAIPYIACYQHLSCHLSQPTNLGTKPKTTKGTNRELAIYVYFLDQNLFYSFVISSLNVSLNWFQVYGYVLDPPSSDQQNAETDEGGPKILTSRTYRLEKNYAVGAGKW